MKLADLSIHRPTFITCIIILMLSVGWISLKKLGVDLFPNVTFPVVVVNTAYPGAGPVEVETLVSKPFEDELSTLSGIKRLSSINREGLSTVIAEFTLETDIKFAEQQIRDRVGSVRTKIPDAVKESVVRRIDPSDQPVLIVSVNADLPPAQLYDLANEVIRPRLEQVPQVGLVDVLGGRKREIHVNLDRDKLKHSEISASQVVARLSAAGENVPVGKVEKNESETVFRTMGEFKNLKDIPGTVVNFYGNEVPVTLGDIGTVKDTLVDETSRTYVNGNKSLFLYIFKQSGANTISVVDALKKKINLINKESKESTDPTKAKAEIKVVRDGSLWIHANVEDVKESIFFGIALAVIVVFFFLGSARSTFITGLALPNSLIGAFILMAIAGFTINVMSLLALSLSVGLLIDDAIVVRENIFRHLEMGKSPAQAASEGTAEVRMAVIATTLAVIAIFGPVGFIPGVVGQFLKEFGLTVCFAMMISLFDALTIAPMLSAYFAGNVHAEKERKGIMGRMLAAFDRFQTMLENKYEALIRVTLRRPAFTLISSLIIFILCVSTIAFVPKTFLPTQDNGEFVVGIDMPPGTNLEKMSEVAQKVDAVIRSNKEVRVSALTIGNREGEANVAEMYVNLVPTKERTVNTSQMKERLRNQLKEFAYAGPLVKDYDPVAAGQRPFTLNILGTDREELEKYATKFYSFLKNYKGLKDVDLSFRAGKPEFQIIPDKLKMESLGLSSIGVGQELRSQIEGVTAAKFREKGLEYDIRVRLKPEERNLEEGFSKTFVPNINGKLIRLADVSKGFKTTGPTKITRQNRNRYVQIAADIAPGAGLSDIINDLTKSMKEGDYKLPEGTTFQFVGQAENMEEMVSGMALAMGLGVLFIYLVLASLYESFVTPFTIMIALPLTFAGSFVALAITQQSLNIFSMIGMILLLGVASKNSILLVDFASQKIREGMSRTEEIALAGKTRLRPILMTTLALIAGTIPITLALNEASRQRVSMGYAIIGGLISSTLLTLIVVPSVFIFLDRFKVWSNRKLKNLVGAHNVDLEEGTDKSEPRSSKQDSLNPSVLN